MVSPSAESPKKSLEVRGAAATTKKAVQIMQDPSAPRQPPTRTNRVSASMSMLLKLHNPEISEESRPALFDAHLHYLDFFQHTEGMQSLMDGMQTAGVVGAMLCGCPLKKTWSQYEDRLPASAQSDTDCLGFYSYTDATIQMTLASSSSETNEKVLPSLCGFDPTDRLAPEHISHLIALGAGKQQWAAIGEVIFSMNVIN